MVTTMDCRTCGAPTTAHCDSRNCDLVACTDPDCRAYGTRDGRRWATR